MERNNTPPQIPKCSFLEQKSGMNFYELEKTLLYIYEPKIKIISIGIENDLDTKNIFLTGETGAGKTSLINALVNHLLGIKFTDNYRYILKDEAGEGEKSLSVSQTEYVVGYLIFARPGSISSFNYLIIDTPGFNDSRGREQDQLVKQQIKSFMQDVDGVDELHCIGFVVNGTRARLHDQFKEVIDTFCDIFGENAKSVIRVMVSFAYMKNPPVLEVLECSSLRDYKRFEFDNGSLNVSNRPENGYLEDDIKMSRLIWDKTAKVYDFFLSELETVDAVSLGLTREALDEIEKLQVSTGRLKEASESYLSLMLNLKQSKDRCREYQAAMATNEKYEGTVDIKVRRRLRHLDWFARLRIHTHNCEKCLTTCRYPCDHLTRDDCPRGGEKCDKCSCPNEDHVRSDDVISHIIEKRSVVHEDKKALYYRFKTQEASTQEEVDRLTQQKDQKRIEMDVIVQEMDDHSEIIKAIILNKEVSSTIQLIEISLDEIKQKKLRDGESHMIPFIEELYQSFRC